MQFFKSVIFLFYLNFVIVHFLFHLRILTCGMQKNSKTTNDICLQHFMNIKI